MTTVHDVAHQMAGLLPDLPPPELVVDGRRRYFGHKKKSWYRLREIRTDGGSFVVVGAFGNYSASKGGFWKVDVDWRGIGAEERERLQALRQAMVASETAERAELARLAAMNAGELWRTAAREGRSPYLDRKGVAPEACRYLRDGSLVIPLLRYDWPREQALVGLQRIWPRKIRTEDGGEIDKTFTKGFAKTGACLRLGLVVHGAPIVICEGYATGLTLRMALERRLPVFVALDAYNLGPVARVVRGLHPASALLFAADDDWHTPGNPGRSKAAEAARELDRCMVTYPIFRPGARGPKETDFNDLHAREGMATVARQLRLVLPELMPVEDETEGLTRAA